MEDAIEEQSGGAMIKRESSEESMHGQSGSDEEAIQNQNGADDRVRRFIYAELSDIIDGGAGQLFAWAWQAASLMQDEGARLEYAQRQAQQSLDQVTDHYHTYRLRRADTFQSLRQSSESLTLRLNMWFTATELRGEFRALQAEEAAEPGRPREVAGCDLATLSRIEAAHDGPDHYTHDMPNPPRLLRYEGACHCGDFAFEVRLPAISHRVVCNCSLCYKTGLSMVSCPAQNFVICKGSLGDLIRYSYDFVSSHHFCGNCGVTLVVLSSRLSNMVYVNFGTLHLSSVEQGMPSIGFLASNRRGGYTQPSAANLPDPACGDARPVTVHGSCHCGRILVKLKAGYQTPDCNSVTKCSCSMCRRFCPVWLEDCQTQATVQRGTSPRPRDSTKRCTYRPSAGPESHLLIFCDVCGVFVCNDNAAAEPAWRAVMEPECLEHQRAQNNGQAGALCPLNVNLRIFIDVDVDTFRAA
ncbi:hypothetical protein RB595_005446 [Gaeumannomyces hyphopodioides]